MTYESIDLYKKLLNQCKDVAWIREVNKETLKMEQIYTSPSCITIYEFTVDELKNDINILFECVTPRSKKILMDKIATFKDVQILGNYLTPKTKKLRKHRWNWTTELFNGKVRYYGTTVDVTDELANITLQISKEHAEMENTKKRSFLERTCHEQRNLHMGVNTGTELTLYNITDIITNVKDLLKDLTETKKIIEVIAESSEQVNYLLDTTLNLQQIDNVNFEYTYSFNNIQDTVNVCTKKFSHTLKTSKVNISISIDPFLCRILLRYDQLKITQSLVNYISNAYKFTNEGHIRIEIKHEMKNELIQLIVEVKDTGVGIDVGIELFELYKQIQPVKDGNGIGLYLVQKFIKDGHNGDVGFRSTLGKGSTFMFSFICQYKMNNDHRNSNTSSHSDELGSIGEDKDILLVEDIPNNRLLISIMLMKLGYKYEEAENGKEALDRIKKTKFKLILTDRKMPKIDGLQLTQLIKERNKDQLIIGITGNSIPDQMEEWRKLGVNEIIIKPCKLEQLKTILGNYLQPICSIGSGV